MASQFLRSRTYAPSAALAPYVARHYVFSVDAPDAFELTDHLLAETAFVRLLLQGDWGAELTPGACPNVGQAVFFGPNSRPMRVRVRGGFRVVGIAFCPAGWRALSDVGVDRFVDAMVPLAEVAGTRADELLADVGAITQDDKAGDTQVVAAIERHVSAWLEARGWLPPEPAMQAFEQVARNRSTALVADICRSLGVSQRQLERMCRTCFGLSPKAVLRRSRFLDMAAAVRGLSQAGEEELAALRFYDQSHLIREFRRFSGMTPGQFEKTPTPLLTAGLELRELRKREDAARV
jgi:AraC-like DNA-binding protein